MKTASLSWEILRQGRMTLEEKRHDKIAIRAILFADGDMIVNCLPDLTEAECQHIQQRINTTASTVLLTLHSVRLLIARLPDVLLVLLLAKVLTDVDGLFHQILSVTGSAIVYGLIKHVTAIAASRWFKGLV